MCDLGTALRHLSLSHTIDRPSLEADLATEKLQKTLGISEPARAWVPSVVYSAIAIGAMLLLAVVVNDLIGRTIHWDWVAYFGSLAFIGMSTGRRIHFLKTRVYDYPVAYLTGTVDWRPRVPSKTKPEG